MARRVRGYVLAGKSSQAGGATHTGVATSRERKALATMGRRGGKKAAQRWNNRNSKYAQAQLQTLRRTQQRKKAEGRSTRARISQFVNERFIEKGTLPTWKEIMEEVNVSRRTVAYHLSALKDQGELPDR